MLAEISLTSPSLGLSEKGRIIQIFVYFSSFASLLTTPEDKSNFVEEGKMNL